MRFFDRLARGVRIFRFQADLRAVETELHAIRAALECICREQFGVELAPAAQIKSPKGAEISYIDDGGADAIDRVHALMRDAGIKIERAGRDPTFENDPDSPFPAFAHRDEATNDDTDSDGQPGTGASAASATALRDWDRRRVTYNDLDGEELELD